jgi:hypothetical protein
VVTARKLRDFPELAQAFADGEIDRQRVDIITDAHTPDRADALVSLCTSNVTVEMSVHVDLKDIEERGGPELAAEIRRTAPNLSKATPHRTACDCNISRVITDGPSQVLDVGRSSRVATAAQRRALEAKYGGCFFPSCDARFERCEIHHKHHWIEGGPTDLDNPSFEQSHPRPLQ